MKKLTREELVRCDDSTYDHIISVADAFRLEASQDAPWPEERVLKLREMLTAMRYDERVVFWSASTYTGVVDFKFVSRLHAASYDLILECFGIAPGLAGVGKVPQLLTWKTLEEQNAWGDALTERLRRFYNKA